MISFFKKTLKVGVITLGLLSLATVAAFAVVGKERTQAVVNGLHGKILESIDDAIDDPSILRAQLREMEKEYPKRIGQVRGDLSELQGEIREIEREIAISERVVVLADQDLQKLETEFAARLPSGETALVAIRGMSSGESPSPSRAVEQRLNQVRSTRGAYANRAADARHDLAYLEKQAVRLGELLAKLENERAEFQTQAMGLSRQIDSIARNDRLIELLERRNKTIEECSRYEAVSLDQISGRLSQIRSRQEAELDVLSTSEESADYENRARMELAAEQLSTEREEPLEHVESVDF